MLWFKLLFRKLQAFSEISILVSSIRQMMWSLLNFFIILGIVFFAFGNSKFVLPGATEGNIFNTLSAEFWASIDEERATVEADGNQYILQWLALEPFFAIFVLLILMNVLVTLLTDLYSDEKEKAEVSGFT